MGKRGPKPGTGGRPKGSGVRPKPPPAPKLPPGVVKVKRPAPSKVKPPGTVDYSDMEILPPQGFGGVEPFTPLLEPGIKKRRPKMADGPKPLVFSDRHRKAVRDMAEVGLPRHMICEHVINPETKAPISISALQAHFGNELREGRRVANLKLATSVYHSAIGTPAEYDAEGRQIRAERAPNTTLQVFLSRVRLGYSWQGGMTGERDPNVAVEPEGPTDADMLAMLEQVSDDELRIIRRALAKALPAS